MRHIILDTDVGTDTDDALALALAVAHPDIRLVGVTTVHADAPFGVSSTPFATPWVTLRFISLSPAQRFLEFGGKK